MFFIGYTINAEIPDIFSIAHAYRGQIMDITPKWFHVFIQDFCADKHWNVRFVYLYIIFSGKRFYPQL